MTRGWAGRKILERLLERGCNNLHQTHLLASINQGSGPHPWLHIRISWKRARLRLYLRSIELKLLRLGLWFPGDSLVQPWSRSVILKRVLQAFALWVGRDWTLTYVRKAREEKVHCDVDEWVQSVNRYLELSKLRIVT